MPDRIEHAAAQRTAFREDVLAGLAKPQKTVPSRWFYDDRGSELFERITGLPEYYLTRTEHGILRDHAAEMADFAGPGAVVVEYGAGAGLKTEILLAALEAPAAYVPIDVAGDFLAASARRIDGRFPGLEVRPVVADFTARFELPADLPAGRRTGFFPGSTIGNLDEATARAFLAQAGRHVGRAGRMILGADRVKAPEVLIAAYDDAAGVTAAFNRNLLERINRELGGDFDPGEFAHEARWNAARSAIEMHLVSRRAQRVRIAGQVFGFRAGESIHTEDCRKYTPGALEALAGAAGWRAVRLWQDAEGLFAVLGLERG